MSEELRFTSARVEFDPESASDLVPIAPEDGDLTAPHVSPFPGYVRTLTAEGGILISYKDQDRGVFVTLLRGFTWTVATGLSGWLLFFESSLNGPQCLMALILIASLNAFLVRRPIEVSHSVEIRPDIMIIDGEDEFYAEDIGDNWPELQMKNNDDPDRMVICGICGTRWIEYMTANRLDKNDRTPEVLAEDLEAAMEQLWGRREVIFAPAF
jgi:hypothetical protein